ncbi:MAG: CPBP family intramembrane metalloprotease [Clostridia bacterium]|nr:CPBP family intramembrane metalloprotease [Clostridia bacterium]
MKQNLAKAAGVYAAGAIIFSALILSAYLAEVALGMTERGLPETAVKLGLMLAVGSYLVKRKALHEKRGNWQYVLLGLLPAAALLILRIATGFHVKNVFDVIGIFTTAASEELYYRAFGTYIFSKCGQINCGRLALMAAIFALAHLVNAVLDPVGALVTVSIALALGTLLQIVYLKTNSLAAVILLHFAVNMLG